MTSIIPKLYVVPTPIGNLGDITFRALDVLKNCDLILAEDTRHTKKLLSHYFINKDIQSFHLHNEHKVLEKYIQNLLINNTTIALVSDAGTPGISDPGFLLVRECVKNNILVETLPGATAFVPALINSGIPCERFIFEGFLPQKKGRETRIKELSKEKRTIVFYESPHRFLKTINKLIPFFGENRQIAVCREISKIYEEIKRDTLINILSYYKNNSIKGEIVIVIKGTK